MLFSRRSCKASCKNTLQAVSQQPALKQGALHSWDREVMALPGVTVWARLCAGIFY